MVKTSIIEASKDLSAKQKVQLKNLSDAYKLDKETQIGEVVLDVEMYAVLSIDNDKVEDGPYETYVIIDKDGRKYTTGSPSFWGSFMDIWEEMAESGEDWKLKIYRAPSRTREGKDFITCTII